MSGTNPLIEAIIQLAPQANPTFQRNLAYAKPGVQNFQTQLSPEQEQQFQQWVQTNSVPYDPSPTTDYDMKGFWLGLQKGDPKATQGVDPNDNQLHFSDWWKTPYHETFSAESQYADPKKAPKWNEKDQLVAPDGTVIFDDRAPKQDDLIQMLMKALGS